MKWSDLTRLDRDDILHRLGLEERTPTADFFSGLGLFAVGCLLGAGMGLLFAPKRGEEIRSQVSEAWRNRRAAMGGGSPDYERDLGMDAAPAGLGTTAASSPMGGGGPLSGR